MYIVGGSGTCTARAFGATAPPTAERDEASPHLTSPHRTLAGGAGPKAAEKGPRPPISVLRGLAPPKAEGATEGSSP